ncbi:EAL domain-containing protein [Ideonella sp.]|uniref:sensor domain-containing protein n=1 Tax=Ideonella sp. TaxID=1929293 RepID=UPI0035B19637
MTSPSAFDTAGPPQADGGLPPDSPGRPASAHAATWLRTLLALVGVVLMVAAWGFVQVTAGLAVASQGDAEALKLAGRQSFLAERLATGAMDVGAGADTARPLEDTLARMLAEATRLNELSGVWSEADGDGLTWTDHRERVWGTVQSLLMARERGESDLGPYVTRVRNEARQFIDEMELATTALQRLAEQRQQDTREAHARLVGLLALGVGALLLGLGEPLARRIQRHHDQLHAQAQELERLAVVADRTPNAVAITDTHGAIVWTNAAFTAITGYAADEARGRTPDALLQFEGTAAATRAAVARARDGALPVRVEILHRGRHGRSYWADLSVQPMRDEAGRLTGFIHVETDISAQVERREYLDAVLRALPAGLMVRDADGRVVDVNVKAEQLIGAPRELLLGQPGLPPGWSATRPDGSPLSAEDLPGLSTLRHGQPQEGLPIAVCLPDGERRWLRINTQLLPAPDGAVQGVISCFLDETEVRAQRHLLQTTIDGAGVGTWDWDMQTGRVDFNDRWLRMFGFGGPDNPPRTVDDWLALMHPEDAQAARRAVVDHLADPTVPYRTEFRVQHRSGGWMWVMAAGAVIERGPDGRGRRMAGVHVDIDARKRLEQALSDAALTDALTQLPNRAGIQHALARCVERVHERPDDTFAVLFMDFDRFKLVNDSLGHEAGDELLRQIAERLRHALRPGDDVARVSELEARGLPAGQPDVAGRLGGDEFVVLLEHLHAPADAMRVARRLLDALGEPYEIGGRQVQSSVSIGIVTSDVSSASVESVLRDADTAMYEAKRLGRGRYAVFQPEMHRRIRHAMELEGDLRQALLSEDQIFVAYQPIVSLPHGRPVALEALVRWRHPADGRLVSPAEFVPLAEEAGLVEQLGERVLRRACLDLAAWQRHLGDAAPRNVSVNLSRAQLRPGRLAATVRSALADAGVPASALRLEITETLAMKVEDAEQVFAELRTMGVALALDDFGTGYSSLASLDQLPIDTVKVDRAFVAKVVDSRYQRALVHSTVQVADALHLRVVAEGVETEEQAAALVALGCHLAQGFLFGRPMVAVDFEAWWADAVRRTAGPAAADTLLVIHPVS